MMASFMLFPNSQYAVNIKTRMFTERNIRVCHCAYWSFSLKDIRLVIAKSWEGHPDSWQYPRRSNRSCGGRRVYSCRKLSYR